MKKLVEKIRGTKLRDCPHDWCQEPLRQVWYKRTVYEWDYQTEKYKEYETGRAIRYVPECESCHCRLDLETESWFYSELRRAELKPSGIGRWKHI